MTFIQNKYLKHYVGYDSIFNEIDKACSVNLENNIAFDVIKYDVNKYQIKIALAGVLPKQISINTSNNLLIINVSERENKRKSDYIHKGIQNNVIQQIFQLDQISSGLKEAKHGIFSYYLMKGLEGNADINKDKKITNGELLAYMDENVSQKASELGRQQNPSLAGDPKKVLMSYR